MRGAEWEGVRELRWAGGGRNGECMVGALHLNQDCLLQA